MIGEKTRIRLGRETLIGLLGLVGMVCLAVGLTGLSFRSQFLPETVINGVDCTSLDPADAADRLLEQAGRETFSLEDARGEVILMGTLAELADRTALEEELAALQAQQQSERGFFAFLGREGLLPGGTALRRPGPRNPWPGGWNSASMASLPWWSPRTPICPWRRISGRWCRR